MRPSSADQTPEEIWYLIADHVAEDTPSKEFPTPLISVHRHLFNYYLDRTYSEVHWTKLDRGTVRQLQRLQSPITASHVKRLRIHAWFIDHLIARDALAQSSGAPKRVVKIPGRFLKWFQRTKSTHGGVDLESSDDFFAKSFAQSKLAKHGADATSVKPIIRAMVSAICLMHGVTTCNFELRNLPLTKDTERFLSSAGRSFGSSLRKLVLHTTIPRFQSIFQLTQFDHLDELELHFDYHSGVANSWDSLRNEEEDHLVNSIAPFINSRKSALQSLVISSTSFVDLSSFFDAIGPLPSIRRLSFNIFFDELHLSDPHPFFRFLHANKSGLFHAEFAVRTPERSPIHNQEVSLPSRRESWAPIQAHLLQSPDLLQNLDTLVLPLIVVSDLEGALSLVTRSSQSLTHLTLSNAKLSLDQFQIVLTQALSNRSFQLEHLSMGLIHLSAEHLKLLATRLPRLQSLVLVYGSVDRETFGSDLELLKLSPVDWDLQHLSIFQGRRVELPPPLLSPAKRGSRTDRRNRRVAIIVQSTVPIEYFSTSTSSAEYDIMVLISQVFGSIKTFKGHRVRK